MMSGLIYVAIRQAAHTTVARERMSIGRQQFIQANAICRRGSVLLWSDLRRWRADCFANHSLKLIRLGTLVRIVARKFDRRYGTPPPWNLHKCLLALAQNRHFS